MLSVGTQTDLSDLTNSTEDGDDDSESEYNLEVSQTLRQKTQQFQDHVWQKRHREVNSIAIR